MVEKYFTVTLGLHKSYDTYCEAFKFSGYRISKQVARMLTKIKVSQTPIELDLVVMTVKELGFKNFGGREEIYTRGRELGFQLCPAEVGPALRLAYSDQPLEESLLVGMTPIVIAPGGRPIDVDVFKLINRGGVLWLSNVLIGRYTSWDPDCHIVFVLPRQ